MAELITEIKLEVQGVDKMKTLINLLDKHSDNLPDELSTSLKELADCESCSYDWSDIRTMLSDPNNCVMLADGVSVVNVTKVNLILKEIHQAIKGKGIYSHIEKSSPKEFQIFDGERFVMGWK